MSDTTVTIEKAKKVADGLTALAATYSTAGLLLMATRGQVPETYITTVDKLSDIILDLETFFDHLVSEHGVTDLISPEIFNQRQRDLLDEIRGMKNEIGETTK